MLKTILSSAAAAVVAGACISTVEEAKLAREFSLYQVFTDHCVLQRDRPIKISGTCPAREAVLVRLAGNVSVAFANRQNEWTAVLPALPAGGPYTLEVQGAEGKVIRLQDVLIGEVWLCSGQSNMAMPLWGEREFFRIPDGREEAAQANYSNIRLFNTNLCAAKAPQGPVQDIAGPGWAVCSPESALRFSAVGYFFGKQLWEDLQVPIGLINCSWGGTPIESWISRRGFAAAGMNALLQDINDLLQNKGRIATRERQEQEAWEKSFRELGGKKSERAAEYHNEDYNDDSWQEVQLPQSLTLNSPGVYWYRRKIMIPSGWQGLDLEVGLGAIDECDFSFFNGEPLGQTGSEEPMYYEKPRVYTVPASRVKAGQLNSIAVHLVNYSGAFGMTGPAQALYIRPCGETGTQISLGGEWKFTVEFTVAPNSYPGRPARTADASSPKFPTTLFNSMIFPWTRYPIRGVIWYQGETNAAHHRQYLALQKALLKDWRRHWQDPDLAFVLVQLAAYQQPTPKDRLPDDFWQLREPEDDDWSYLREAQAALLKERHTGMAVSIDIGDHSDIHPANKRPLGLRLAREAERICYGYQPISAGPLYRRKKREGDKIRIFFHNADNGLKAQGDALGSFAIAGADGKYYWAEAVIEQDTVLVWSPAVPEPREVRYAWARYPGNANLYNREGFPASPFRTDK
jgi:sialate O-acetylesterase